MRSKQAGNAIVIILVAVFLFGALAAFFMRGAKSGQGNLTQNQARLAAQEIATFFSTMDKAVQKLRSRGCSENDISFANPADTGSHVTSNDRPTAPPDKSCHVFDPAGGGVNFNMDWKKYQVNADQLSSGQTQIGNINFRSPSRGVLGVGTSDPEYMTQLNFVKPEICTAYNKITNSGVSETIFEADNADPYGTVNTTLIGKTTFCHHKYGAIQNGLPHIQIVYVWQTR